jgi:hypothetical protein
MRRSLVPASGAYALWRMRDGVPLLGALRTSAVVGAAPSREETRASDGPTEASIPTPPREERRLPEDRDAFHRHATRRSRFAEGLLPPAFAPALSLTPPTRCPLVGDQVLLLGIARSRCGHPRVRELRECRRLFYLLEPSRLGLTTQARQRARPTRPSTRSDCLARTDAGRNA